MNQEDKKIQIPNSNNSLTTPTPIIGFYGTLSKKLAENSAYLHSEIPTLPLPPHLEILKIEAADIITTVIGNLEKIFLLVWKIGDLPVWRHPNSRTPSNISLSQNFRQIVNKYR